MTVVESEAGRNHVQSLARGLAVLTAFDADHRELTLADVARRTDLSRAAARRFLLTLGDLGFVRTDGKHFALTPQVLRLGAAYLTSLGLPEIAAPHLERLSATVGESSSCAVLDRDDVVYVARVATRRIMSVGIAVGTRFPAYATSMGRVLLAGLDDAELDDYFARTDRTRLAPTTLVDEKPLRMGLTGSASRSAFVDEELEIGLRSVAAPILDARGLPRASVNVSMSGAPTELEPRLASLLEAAAVRRRPRRGPPSRSETACLVIARARRPARQRRHPGRDRREQRTDAVTDPSRWRRTGARSCCPGRSSRPCCRRRAARRPVCEMHAPVQRMPCSAGEGGQHQHPLISGCQIGILVASVAAVDVPVVPDPVGKATGTAGGDGVRQVDPAVAVEHDRFTGMGIDRRDEHRLWRPALTGQPRRDGGAPLSLPRTVRRRIHVEGRGAHPAAHVGGILGGGDACLVLSRWSAAGLRTTRSDPARSDR